MSAIIDDVVQRYEIVEGKTVQELVKLVNIKTKNGWAISGGMVYVPTNFCPIDSDYYPFCQTIYKVEYKKNKKVTNKNVK